MSSPRLSVGVLSAVLLGVLFVAPAPTTRATPGDFVASAVVPVTASLGVGITFDGVTFWYSNYHDATLYGFTASCAGATCQTTLTHTEPIRDATTQAAVSVGSMAYDATRQVIWAGADGSSGVYRIDPATGLATHAFDASTCSSSGLVDGLAYDAINDIILYSPDGSHTACQYSPTGVSMGAISIDSISGFPGCYNSGLAIGGDVLYMGSDGCGKIVAVDRTSLANLGVFASPGGRDEGMTCDDVTFAPRSVIWSKDAYDNHITAFEIAPGTCATGGGTRCTTPFAVTIDDPQTGYDYDGATKTAQSPPLPAPRLAGLVTLRAHATPAIATSATFYVDGVAVGSSAAPFATTWDASTVTPGAHSLSVRMSDGASCRATGTQAIVSTCGAPLVNAITRPAKDAIYLNDVAHPSTPGAPVLLSDTTVRASTSDATRVASADWLVDGTSFATGVTGSPYAALMPVAGLSIGLHTLTLRLHETDARCTDEVQLPVRVSHIVPEGTSQGIYVATAQPEQLIAHTVPSDGNEHHEITDRTVSQVGLRVQAVTDDSTTSATSAHASSQLVDVSLLSGLVQAKLLRGEANAAVNATTLAFSTSAAGSHIVGLTVNGVPVLVTDPNTVIPLPAGNRLVVNEQTLVQTPGHVELRVDALHLYTNVNGLRSETILGQAVAGVDVQQLPFEGRARLIAPQDDDQIGHDASDSRTAPTMLAVGNAGSDLGTLVFGGRVGGSDQEDDYGVQVAQGEKLVVVIKPSNDAGVEGSTLAPPPAFSGVALDPISLPDVTATLFDPDEHHIILRSDAPASAPEQLVLNVNETGVWTFSVAAKGLVVVNYTVSVSVLPAPLVAEAPAGLACGDVLAPMLDGRGVTSSLSGTGARQVYRVHADLGDDFSATLVMPDAVGQDLDLTLYAPDCTFIAESKLGKRILFDGDAPKGASDAVAMLPVLGSGDYWLEVSRFVGQGNYQLTPTTASPLPTIPMNDALTGADASDDTGAPTPLVVDRGVFEGRWTDGDARDVYSFTVGAGERVLVTFLPSPANTGTMELTGAGLTVNRGQDALGHGSFELTNPSTSAGLVTLVFTPTLGGGNYAFSVMHA